MRGHLSNPARWRDTDEVAEGAMNKWHVGGLRVGGILSKARRAGESTPDFQERMAPNGMPARYYVWGEVKAWLGKQPRIVREKKTFELGPNARELAALRAHNKVLQNEIGQLKAAQVARKRCLRGMLSVEEICFQAKEYQHLCGVYFLVADSDVVYVGQSVDIHGRIGQHFREGYKKFTHYYYILCERERLDILERAYITVIKPVYNSVHGHMKEAIVSIHAGNGELVGRLPE